MFLDSSAWMDYFVGSTRGERVRSLMESSRVLYACPMVLAEVGSKVRRTEGAESADRCVSFIEEHAAIVEHTVETGVRAGRIHAEMRERSPKFSMADAFVLASARSRNARVVTCDADFRGLEEAIVV